jgi:hypothetical protein
MGSSGGFSVVGSVVGSGREGRVLSGGCVGRGGVVVTVPSAMQISWMPDPCSGG